MTTRFAMCALAVLLVLDSAAAAQAALAREPWAEGWFANGSQPGRRTGLDTTRARTGSSSGHLTLSDGGTAMFSVFLSPREYVGKRVRFSAYVRTSAGSAGLWMRVDGSTGTLGFDNMSDRPIRPVPTTVATTGPPVRQTPIDPGMLARMVQNYQASPSRPSNLGFELRR